MDFYESDLRDVFFKVQTGEFSYDHALIIIYNILCSLKFLKSANIVHRDIKPANILINDACHVKLCDLGLARTLPQSLNSQKASTRPNVEDDCLV